MIKVNKSIACPSCITIHLLSEKIKSKDYLFTKLASQKKADEIIISQDPWRLILDAVMLMRSSNSTLNNLDIWMTPEVCNAFLRSKDKHVKVYLSQIHKQCRDKDPDKRPNAGQLVKSYKDVQLKLQLSPSI